MALAVIGSSPITYPMQLILSKNRNMFFMQEINKSMSLKYIQFFINSFPGFFFQKNFSLLNLLRGWIFKYVKILSFWSFSLNLGVFLFFQDKFLKFRDLANIFSSFSYLLIMTFRSMHLRVNYYDIYNYIHQYYSIGMLLNMFKLESKSYRRSLKGIKVLLNFLSKKINKKYFRHVSLIKVNGLTKHYLKFFYLLSSVINILSVRVFLWNPIKSWDKNGVKKIKSIKRRIKKKLIKIEQKI